MAVEIRKPSAAGCTACSEPATVEVRLGERQGLIFRLCAGCAAELRSKVGGKARPDRTADDYRALASHHNSHCTCAEIY